MIITANSLMPSHPGPQWKMYGGLIQIPCQESYSSKIRIEHCYIQFSLFYCWWYTLWFCWPWGIPVEKHVNDKNIESNHQMPDIVEKHISGTEITNCIHIAEIETQAFCFQLHMQTYWLSVQECWKASHHWTARIPILTKSQCSIRILHHLQLNGHNSFTATKTRCNIAVYFRPMHFHLSMSPTIPYNKTQVCCPEWRIWRTSDQ